MQISSVLARRSSILALVALLGLAVTFATTSASSATSGHAVAAKKHCKKKKGKKSATAAKKKKCKKKHAAVPPAAPLTRSAGTIASITWDTADQVDMHVFDASGNEDYYNKELSTIPDAVENDQEDPGTPETFEDLQSPSTRTFTYYVCLYNYADIDQLTGPVHVIADITDPGGTHRSIPITLNGIDDEAFVAVSPSTGTAFPASNFCHKPETMP
jgi:putative hemolysin